MPRGPQFAALTLDANDTPQLTDEGCLPTTPKGTILRAAIDHHEWRKLTTDPVLSKLQENGGLPLKVDHKDGITTGYTLVSPSDTPESPNRLVAVVKAPAETTQKNATVGQIRGHVYSFLQEYFTYSLLHELGMGPKVEALEVKSPNSEEANISPTLISHAVESLDQLQPLSAHEFEEHGAGYARITRSLPYDRVQFLKAMFIIEALGLEDITQHSENWGVTQAGDVATLTILDHLQFPTDTNKCIDTEAFRTFLTEQEGGFLYYNLIAGSILQLLSTTPVADVLSC